MKAKELLRLLREASDTAEVKVENGEIVVIEPEPIKYKFKVGDKVEADGQNYKITDAIAQCGNPAYRLDGLVGIVYEGQINGYAPKDITEIIKTFEDAMEWCNKNGFQKLTDALTPTIQSTCDADIVAYLKLRITTCALNEGWEPKFDGVEEMYFPFYGHDEIRTEVLWKINSIYSRRMAFKTNELAIYAATHFRDIYADFCGCKKGGEE